MSGGLELPGGPGSRAAREEEARLPITRATPGVHQGVEAEAASEAPSRRGPAPKGAEAEAAWEAAASRLAPSGVSGALAPPQVSFAGDRAKRQKALEPEVPADEFAQGLALIASTFVTCDP